MKNTFGTALCVTLFGESHGSCVGAVADGFAPGIPVDEARIAAALEKRRPHGDGLSTARVEPDRFFIDSGVYHGKTTGTPLCIRIENTAQNSAEYPSYGIARPGHADLTGFEKYHGFEDPRGGGHFSGRITAALVAVGAVARDALAQKGVRIGTHLSRCAGIDDRGFGDLFADFALLSEKDFPVLDEEREAQMKAAVRAAAQAGDSVGGILETAVTGFFPGVGEPWFDSAEGVLSHLLFSVPGVKGVAFGGGFSAADIRGSEWNGSLGVENGVIRAENDQNGGIFGGICSGDPILFRCAVKPTASVAKSRPTVDFRTGQPTEVSVSGRHDPCIAPRARAVVDAVTALGLYDLSAVRFGTDFFRG